jgi:putative membrane protein
VSLFAVVGPLDRLADDKLLSAHMGQHVLIGDLGPALMVTAVRGPLLVFLLPAAVLAPLARSSRVRAVVGTLLRPRVAFSLWAANLAIWHIPYLYDLALEHEKLHDFEHLCWTLTGILVWTLLVDPGSHRRLSVGGRVALAAAMFAAGQILTDVLVFSFTSLYPAYHGAYGISAVTDQQLAGIVMMVEQLLTLGTCVALLLRPRRRRSRAARLAAAT